MSCPIWSQNVTPALCAQISLKTETEDFDDAIEQLHVEAFGPGRFTRAAFKLREGGPHARDLSFVIVDQGDRLIASVRLTHIAVVGGKGELNGRGYLLGPLAVLPEYKNQGLGKALVAKAIDAAKQRGIACVILVGDAPYYEPLGFVKTRYGQLKMPLPVDQNRLLIAPLKEGIEHAIAGKIIHGALL